ncbi:DUF177 domain-containing protein [Chloroflexota bacterium]
MQFNVAQQLKSSIGSSRSYRIDESIDLADEGRDVCLLQGGVDLLRTDRGILAKGNFETGVRLVCSRCLGLFQCPLRLTIEEEYFPSIDVVSGIRLPPPEEACAFTIDGNHILDLSEATRQYILLATPLKPLCRPDCAGLCSYCGHNLNQGSCGCRTLIPTTGSGKTGKESNNGTST